MRQDEREELYGYCRNDEDHYGRICEYCGCCYQCCSCEHRVVDREARLARLRARFAVARESLGDTAELLRDVLEARGVPCRYDESIHGAGQRYWLLPRVSVSVSSSRAYGAHLRIRVGYVEDILDKCSDLDALADRVAASYAVGTRKYLERHPDAAEKIDEMRKIASRRN